MTTNVFCFVPAFGQQITAATVMTLQGIQMTLARHGIGFGFTTLSFPDIAELRSMIATIFYDGMPQCSHLLMIDSDMGFSPDLVLHQLLLDEPLVGTIYPQRRLPTSWAGSGTGEAQAERRGDFMRVEGVGMGCTLIRRDCLDAIVADAPRAAEAHIDSVIGDRANAFRDAGVYEEVRTMLRLSLPPFFDERIEQHPGKEMLANGGTKRIIRFFDELDIPGRGKISEDLSFCIRAGWAGVPTWAAIGHRISHVGPFDFAARYLDQVEAAQ